MTRDAYPRIGSRVVDTCALARRLVRDEVPNCKLSTLAERFRLAHRPSHRALDDALATGDLLHALLERAAAFGVLGLEDLLELPTLRGHPQIAKLAFTTALPRRPGVYFFLGAGRRVLYVGKARDIRSRVRSYFSGDDRRNVDQLLRETVAIDHVVTRNALEAAVLEVRMIHRHQPPFNRQAKLWRRYVYLKLTLNERFPRLSVVRVAKPGDGCLYLGPIGSTAAARTVADAIESAVPIRRCNGRPGRTPKPWPCPPAQLGVATCPCSGAISEIDYAELVGRVVRGLTCEPRLLLDPLADRMRDLAAAQRFEEAASTRDRADALARTIVRQRRFDGLRRAGRVEVAMVDVDEPAVLGGGQLVGRDELPIAPADGPVPRDLADELSCVAAWFAVVAVVCRGLVRRRGRKGRAPAAALRRRAGVAPPPCPEVHRPRTALTDWRACLRSLSATPGWRTRSRRKSRRCPTTSGRARRRAPSGRRATSYDMS